MIVSHKHKFIFIKTRKTAGTSIETALSDLCEPEDIITPISADDKILRKDRGGRGPQNYIISEDSSGKGKRPLKFYNHMPASGVRKYISGDVWDSYFRFCYERNPCEKIISLCHHSKKVRGLDISLPDFIESESLAEYSDWYRYAENDAVIVNHVGRYENLHDDYVEVLRNLGITSIPELPLAKGAFRENKTLYHEILDEAQILKIKQAFPWESSYFKY